MGLPPTLWQHFRQIVGRALRETGQSLDRLGVKTASLAVTKHTYYDDPVIYEDTSLSRHRHQFPLLTSGRPVVHPDTAYLAPCSTLTGSVFVGKGSSIWYGAVLRGDCCQNAESFKTKYALEEGLVDSPIKSNEGEEDEPLPAKLQENQNGLHQNSDTSSSPSASSDVPAKEDANKETAISVEQPLWWQLSEGRYNDRLDHHGGAIFIGANTNIQDGCVVTARSQHCRIGNGVTVGHLAQLHSCTVHDHCLIGMGSVLNAGVVVETQALVAAGAVVPADTVIRRGELWVGNPARKVRDLTAAERQRLHYQSSEYVQVAHTQRGIMQLGGCNETLQGTSVHLIPTTSSDDEDEADEEEPLQIGGESAAINNNGIAKEKEAVREALSSLSATQQQQDDTEQAGFVDPVVAERRRRQQQQQHDRIVLPLEEQVETFKKQKTEDTPATTTKEKAKEQVESKKQMDDASTDKEKEPVESKKKMDDATTDKEKEQVGEDVLVLVEEEEPLKVSSSSR